MPIASKGAEMSLESIYEGLTEEQKQMAKECKTPGEMLALTSKLGVELTDEELDAISAESAWSNDCDYCPKDSNAWS